MTDAPEAEGEDTGATQEITLITIEPGGENAPGIYWGFSGDDTEGESVRYYGPFETEAAAIEAAQAAIKKIYETLLKQMLGIENE